MHIEFRISCIESICAFEPESFIRMHQLKHRPLDKVSLKQSLVTLPEDKAASSAFRPRVQLQFVLENLVLIESSEVVAEVESRHHERQMKTNWDTSEIRTKRYRCHFVEAIVASLPFFVAERQVKIRLVQLAPQFGTQETALISASCPFYSQLSDTSLCIGVAKITLRELLVRNGGISVMLQPKQNMVSAVAALNLNTPATNSMFGKDAGGSAAVTFQAVSFIFNRKAFSSLLSLSPYKDSVSSAPLQLSGDDKDDLESLCCGTKTAGLSMERVVELRGQMNSPVVRFVLVPYVVLMDTLLRLNEAVSWKNPARTFLLLTIIYAILSADVLGLGLMLGLMVELITTLRMAFFFYRVPTLVSQSTDVNLPLSGRRDSFHPVLYGCHNRIINSMVRARLFFSQGLQADCYFELAFLFYRIRRAQRWLLPFLALSFLSWLVFSMETLVVLLLFNVFFVHPVMLRVSFYRLRKIWSRQSALQNLWKAITLSRPMRVSRLVQVTEWKEKRSDKLNLLSLEAPCFTNSGLSLANLLLPPSSTAVMEDPRHPRMLSSNLSTERLGGAYRHMEDSAPLPGFEVPWTRVFSSSGTGDCFASGSTCNNLQPPLSSTKMVRGNNDNIAHDSQQWSLLTFAVIVLSGDTPLAGGNNNGNSIKPNASNVSRNSVVVQKYRRILHRARALDRPPPTGLAWEQYRAYFNSVLGFLQFLRRHCTLDTYMSVLPPTSLSSSTRQERGMVKLDHLAHLSWLVEKGEDDGITSTLLAHTSHQVVLSKLQPLQHIDCDARAFALLAVYLLQGFRLSLYDGARNRGCSVIIPLKMGSNDIEVASEPNPCPPSLKNALVGFWKGLTEDNVPINISTDVVMKIIATYKDSWGPDGAASTTGLDYSHLMLPPVEENEAARDTTKRSIKSFNATLCANKLQSTVSCSNVNLRKASFQPTSMPLDIDASMLGTRRAARVLGSLDTVSGWPENSHGTTPSLTCIPSTFQKTSQRVVSVPRIFMQNLPSASVGSSRLSLPSNTRAGSESMKQTSDVNDPLFTQ